MARSHDEIRKERRRRLPSRPKGDGQISPGASDKLAAAYLGALSRKHVRQRLRLMRYTTRST